MEAESGKKKASETIVDPDETSILAGVSATGRSSIAALLQLSVVGGQVIGCGYPMMANPQVQNVPASLLDRTIL